MDNSIIAPRCKGGGHFIPSIYWYGLLEDYLIETVIVEGHFKRVVMNIFDNKGIIRCYWLVLDHDIRDFPTPDTFQIDKIKEAAKGVLKNVG